MENLDKPPIDTEGTLIIDYYSAPIAPFGEAVYTEITINRAEDSSLFLNFYQGEVNSGVTTKHAAYHTEQRAVDEVLAAAKKYRLGEWNNQAGFGLMGGKRVVKFPGQDGELIRVSTDCAPKELSWDINAPFIEISSILYRYMTEDKRVK